MEIISTLPETLRYFVTQRFHSFHLDVNDGKNLSVKIRAICLFALGRYCDKLENKDDNFCL